MRILTFTSLFPNAENPDFGIFVKNRMKAFSLLPDVELKVVAPVPWFPPVRISEKWFRYSQIPRHEVIDGIEVHHPRYLVTPKIGMTLYGFWMFWGSLGCLRKLQCNFPFDLIDSHFVYPDGLAAVLLGRFFNKPIVVSARGTDVNLYPKFPLINNLIRATIKRADHLVSVSQSLADIMIDEGGNRKLLSVIPNGIDPQNFFPLNQEKCQKKLTLSTDKEYLLTVGGLIERKGIHLLIDALCLLKEQGKLNFITLIIGKGELQSLLERKIVDNSLEDWVQLVGHVSNSDLVDWYNAADLFFLGSSREGWPNVVCEAQACGVPVVATPANGIPEILDSEELGIMVERTPEDFSRGILQAFSRDWNRQHIAFKGQQRTWKNVANEVHELFTAVLNNAKN